MNPNQDQNNQPNQIPPEELQSPPEAVSQQPDQPQPTVGQNPPEYFQPSTGSSLQTNNIMPEVTNVVATASAFSIKKIFLIILGIVLLGAISFGGWYLFIKKPNSQIDKSNNNTSSKQSISEIGVTKQGGPFEFTIESARKVDAGSAEYELTPGEIAVALVLTVRNISDEPAQRNWYLTLSTETRVISNTLQGLDGPLGTIAPGQVWSDELVYQTDGSNSVGELNIDGDPVVHPGTADYDVTFSFPFE